MSNYKNLKRQLAEEKSKNQALRLRNDMLQCDIDYLHDDRKMMDKVLQKSSKETDEAIMTARFLTHILIFMDILEKMLDNNSTFGRVIKTALNNFKAEIANSMLTFQFDGKNVWYDPSVKDKDDEAYDEDYA